MHPHINKKTSTSPYEESQWLGFFNMQPRTEPRQIGSKIHNIIPDSPTPVKTVNTIAPSSKSAPVSSSYEFTFRRESSKELSAEARKVMEETREQAALIRAKLAAEAAEKTQSQDNMGDMHSARKMAHPKGRFSDVHKSAFNRMDSIANHASAWRVEANHPKASASASASSSPMRPQGSAQKVTSINGPHLSTLKRSRSKTDLCASSSNDSYKSPTATKSEEQARSAKRTKTGIATNNASRVPAVAGEAPKSIPTTPRGMLRSALYTPTKSSLARSKSVTSVKSTKIPMLGHRLTISQANSTTPVKVLDQITTLTPTFLSPTKSPAQPLQEQPRVLKATFKASTPNSVHQGGKQSAPYTPVVRGNMSHATQNAPTPTPNRIHVLPSSRPLPHPPLNSPKAISNVFKIKSILRTPMRLYSNDPQKIAAGTHMATPPSVKVPATAPVVKHVDFSASARLKAARDEANSGSEEPEVTYPQMPASAPQKPQARNIVERNPIPGDFTFRAGNEIKFGSPLSSTIRAVRTSNESPTVRVVSQGTKRQLGAFDEPKSRRSYVEDSEHDKENVMGEDVERPSKRLRAGKTTSTTMTKTASAPTTKKPMKKPTAPSSSSRPAKRGGALSTSRLAYLSQPKKR
jgi:hypothetical protein